MDINEICEQNRVDNLFIPLKESFPDLKDGIEQIEFLFKNSIYNRNRLKEELQRLNQGFIFPNKELSFQMEIPVTLWADIIGFEFQSCIFNIIRTINYTLYYKLKYLDLKSLDETPSIGQYVGEKGNSTDVMFSFFSENYFSWIKKLNKIRNTFTHKVLVKKFVGLMKMKQSVQKESPIKNEGKIIAGCVEYDCLNFEEFLNEEVDLLELFLKDFFIKYGELKK